MAQKSSVLLLSAGVVAVLSMSWLLWNIDAHANLIQRETADTFTGIQEWVRPAELPETGSSDIAGLDMVHIYECMCGYSTAQYGVGGWIGLWLVTFVVGGIPTAVLAHWRLANPRS